MTEFESKCYGMSEQDIQEQYINSITGELVGQEMVVMGILSDCQHLQCEDGDMSTTSNAIRKQLNIAKFILSEMMKAKGV